MDSKTAIYRRNAAILERMTGIKPTPITPHLLNDPRNPEITTYCDAAHSAAVATSGSDRVPQGNAGPIRLVWCVPEHE